MTASDIDELVRLLIFNKKIKSQSAFAESIGYNKVFLNKVLKGNSAPPEAMIKAIKARYPVTQIGQTSPTVQATNEPMQSQAVDVIALAQAAINAAAAAVQAVENTNRAVESGQQMAADVHAIARDLRGSLEESDAKSAAFREFALVNFEPNDRQTTAQLRALWGNREARVMTAAKMGNSLAPRTARTV